MEGVRWELDEPKSFASWSKILDRVESEEMPPPTESPLDQSERRAFTASVRQDLEHYQRQQYTLHGRTPLRRLNRREYERTVQSLLGIKTPLQHLLPDEQAINGFDTVSEGLRISPLHMERFVDAARVALQSAIRWTPPPKRIDQKYFYRDQEGIRSNVDDEHAVVGIVDNAAVLFTNASYITKLHGLSIEETGFYTIRMRCWAHQSPDKPVIARIHAGNYASGTYRILGMFDAVPNEPREFEVTSRLEHGEYLYPAPDDLHSGPDNQGIWNVGAKKFKGSGLAVEWMEVVGPHEPVWPPESVSRIYGEVPIKQLDQSVWRNHQPVLFEVIPVDPIADMRRVITQFASRAFRHPRNSESIEPFVQLSLRSLESGAPFDDATRVGITALLCSPNFLILDERPGRLDAFALASRLSYFLTSDMPDEALMGAAADNSLLDERILEQQVDRLLSDPRSDDFVRSFIGQWLDLNKFQATNPDMRLYPEFDDSLKQSMVDETHAFFREVLDHNLPVANLVDSKFCMLNRRLAEHYGVGGVQGQSIRRVELPDDSPRGGLLTQASILKVTANGTVTSPVIRGAWIMSRLLSQPPRPPPPNVGSIEPDTRGATTIREQLALHRNAATCNGCHAKFDPAGFALENFDVIGGWRDRYRTQDHGDAPTYLLNGRSIWEYKLGPRIDATGQLASGESFGDIREFKRLLLQNQDTIAKSVVEKLLVYSTGHPIELPDRATVEQIVGRTRQNNHGLRTIIHAIVQCDLFRSK